MTDKYFPFDSIVIRLFFMVILVVIIFKISGFQADLVVLEFPIFGFSLISFYVTGPKILHRTICRITAREGYRDPQAIYLN